MTVILELANGKPVNEFGMADVFEVQSISRPSIEELTKICNCCCAENIVFANPGQGEFQNDKKDFIFRRVLPPDTIEIKLFKDGQFLADLNDNTYGEFFNFGDLANPNYKGYLLYWENVYNIHGGGTYQIQADQVIASIPSTFTSPDFELQPAGEALL